MRNLENELLRRREPASIDVPEGQVRILESHHAVDFEMELGAWPFHKICWVAVGRGWLETGGKRVSIGKDDFLLLPAAQPHRFGDEPKEPLTLVVLCISGKFLSQESHEQLRSQWDSALARLTPGRPLRARTAFHLSSLVESFRLALREQDDRRPGWQAALGMVAFRLILDFARGYGEPGETHLQSSMRAVEGAIEYIDTHVHEQLNIEQMAARTHLSSRRFTTLFKQATGRTFSDYLNRKRIAYACQRLDETGHILYACHSSGFNDLAYFYRVFKNLKGMTPGQYLRSDKPARECPFHS
jgi:AraC-like DNA-binding protein/mannose-6-phosphate isomerase-like protein (cupin superfamily)